MSLASFFTRIRRSFAIDTDASLLKLNLDSNTSIARAETIIVDRPLTEHEYAIARWLLINANPPATAFLPQLDVARVSCHCSCGCPTADLRLPEDTSRVEARDNPIGDAIGEVSGKTVGVMLLQSDGYLRCLEIYDLSDIEHPYGLPDLTSLRPWDAAPVS